MHAHPTLCSLIPMVIVPCTVAHAGPQETASQPAPDGPETAARWTIHFDISPIDRLVIRAEEVLEDPDAFWQTDPAYHLVRSWHEWNNIPIPMRTWRTRVEAYANMSRSERNRSPAVRMARKLRKQKNTLLQKAVPHICSFLPDLPTGMTTTIYFTAETYPRAIGVGDNVVLDVTNDYWQGSDSTLLNTAVHELFHAAYGWHLCAQTETPLANAAVYAQLSTLHNEGLATFVAYKAQHLFPAPAEQDYTLLDDPARVRRAHKLVNRLLREAETLSPDKLCKDAWRIGVEQRAFYVLGAHMARTIDENVGRDAVADTIARGPRSFVSAYNNVVDEEQRVVEFQAPDQPSWPHRLRLAAAQRDYDTLRQLLATAALPEAGDMFAAEEPFICAGRLLLRHERYDLAVEVLECTTRLFPELAAGHYFLGEACRHAADADRAVASYRRTLELDPGHLYAPARLKALEKAASAEPE
ncbi:MAG: tetratricopeptide repeat protein [Phycisphaerales bacterium]|nr:MAG: tetratricopeptide repeat protein [Phycisphaerales bacterium]